MTKMLASVGDLARVKSPVSGGADIVDMSTRKAGTLGAVATDFIRGCRQVGGRPPRSPVRCWATCLWCTKIIRARAEEEACCMGTCLRQGRLLPSPDAASPARSVLAPSCGAHQPDWLCCSRTRGPDFGLVGGICRARFFHAVVVDTADKTKGTAARSPCRPEQVPVLLAAPRRSA